MVDNGSDDGSREYVEDNFPEVEVLNTGTNIGFGRAFNAVFEKFRGFDYYAIINNDASPEPEWLGYMVETAEKNEDAGIVGLKVLYSQKKNGKYVVNTAGMVVDRHDYAYDRHDGEFDSSGFAQVEVVDAVSGVAMLIRDEALRQVKGFDIRMFMYYEDVDLCLRVKDSGWKIIYDGRAVVYHDHEATSKAWGNFKRNIASPRNRILSIWSRRGVFPAMYEAARFATGWGTWKIAHVFTGVSFKDWLLRKS
jgi:hypothetical protein